MTPTKTAKIQAHIHSVIDDLDIAPFIADEAHHFINQLTYYKIKKIADQEHVFARYLCALDKENTAMMKKAVSL